VRKARKEERTISELEERRSAVCRTKSRLEFLEKIRYAISDTGKECVF